MKMLILCSPVNVSCEIDDWGLTAVTSKDIVDGAAGSSAVADNAVGSLEIVYGAVHAVDINSSQL